MPSSIPLCFYKLLSILPFPAGDEIPITYIPASDAVVFRTSMLTRVAEGEELVGPANRRGEESVANRRGEEAVASRRAEESVEQARRRSRSKSVERTQVRRVAFVFQQISCCSETNNGFDYCRLRPCPRRMEPLLSPSLTWRWKWR